MSPDQPNLIYLPPLCFAVLALALGWRAGWRRRLLDDTPTSKTLGVFIGEVELEGVCVTTNPIQSLFSEIPCVIYEWEICEEWQRWETETYTDKEGRRRTRRVLRKGWTLIAGNHYWQGFYLKDEYGFVWVHPDGAKLSKTTLFDEYTHRGSELYRKGPREEINDSTGRRWFREVGLPVGTSLFVRGRATERPDIVAPQIVKDERSEMFIISTEPEKSISDGYATAYFVWNILGLFAAIGGTGVMMISPDGTDSVYPIVGGLIYIVIWMLGWVLMVFNSLVGLRNRVRQAKSLIEVQVKRRMDLIPQLLTCLQALRRYEAELQGAIAELRSQSGLLTDIKAISPTMIAVAENYPVLMTDQSFQSLSKNLKETEDRIALARNYANDITTFYNTRLERIPDCFVAQLGQMAPEGLFHAEGFEQKVVPVGF